MSAEFQQICRENNIVTLYMPSHSSHVLQPLDVGCFSPLKRAYSDGLERLSRLRFNHMTKDEFLPIFKESFEKALIVDIIKNSFQATGHVPFSPDVVLSSVRSRQRATPDPIEDPEDSTPRTPQNDRELNLHLDSRKGTISDLDPQVVGLVDQVGKYARKSSARAEMSETTSKLLRHEVNLIQGANAQKRRRDGNQRGRISGRECLTIGECQEIINSARSDSREGGHQESERTSRPYPRRMCKETGHTVTSKTIRMSRNYCL
ncbi:hypothetical protein K3495_g7071 [Podosphaera aphanis]|nr:hypothetical protein K3495_g7071 [Podosphaera aphanis]